MEANSRLGHTAEQEVLVPLLVSQQVLVQLDHLQEPQVSPLASPLQLQTSSCSAWTRTASAELVPIASSEECKLEPQV